MCSILNASGLLGFLPCLPDSLCCSLSSSFHWQPCPLHSLPRPLCHTKEKGEWENKTSRSCLCMFGSSYFEIYSLEMLLPQFIMNSFSHLIAMKLIPLSGSIPLFINQLSVDLYSGQRVKLSNIFCFSVLSRAKIGSRQWLSRQSSSSWRAAKINCTETELIKCNVFLPATLISRLWLYVNFINFCGNIRSKPWGIYCLQMTNVEGYGRPLALRISIQNLLLAHEHLIKSILVIFFLLFY